MKRKRKRKTHRSKQRVLMARSYRKGGVRMARYRRYKGSRSRGFGGGFKGMLPPILGGLADAVINPRSPIDGIGSTAVGFVMHDSVVKTIGLYQIGQSIAGFIPFIGGGSGGIGGSQV